MLDNDQRLDLFVEMKKKELTQIYVAHQAEISQGLLSRYLSGRANMSRENEARVIDIIRNADVCEWRKKPKEKV